MSNVFRGMFVIFCIFAISGCSVVNILKLRNANNDVEPLWSHTSSHFKIRTDYIGEKTYIYGTVNGVEGFKFMVDTGASFTYLFDTPKVVGLNLPKGYELSIGGWGDESDSLGHQISMESLSFGGLKVKDFQGAFLQVSKTKYFERSDELIFDGVIGHDLLRHFVWTFDKKAKQVSVSNKPHQTLNGVIGLPFDTFMSKISIDGNIDFGNGHKIEHEFIIDTGSRHYFKLSSEYPKANGVALPQAQVTAADFGLSGKAEHQRVTLPQIELGNIEFNNIKTNIIETDDEDDYWIIGNATFNQFVTTVDYQSSMLYLTPYNNQPFKSRYNLLGLEVRKLLSGDFVVRYVMPNSPAMTEGFTVGDVITQVNDINTNNISKDEWLSISATPGAYTLCLTSLTCKSLKSHHIKGFSQM